MVQFNTQKKPPGNCTGSTDWLKKSEHFFFPAILIFPNWPISFTRCTIGRNTRLNNGTPISVKLTYIFSIEKKKKGERGEEI